MEINNLYAEIEAILFASGEPIEIEKLADVLDVTIDVANKLIFTMQDMYDSNQRGLMLVKLNESVQLCTKPQFAQKIKDILEIRRNIPLSNAAMEILAIIAYNQPVTKSFIEQIRGVDSSQTVNSLVEKGLVEEAGRLEIPGRPISYKTTANFLRNFGLNSLENLPPLPDESGQVIFDELMQKTDEE